MNLKSKLTPFLSQITFNFSCKLQIKCVKVLWIFFSSLDLVGGKRELVDFKRARASGPRSTAWCGGYVVVEHLPQEPSWERRAAVRRAFVH